MWSFPKNADSSGKPIWQFMGLLPRLWTGAVWGNAVFSVQRRFYSASNTFPQLIKRIDLLTMDGSSLEDLPVDQILEIVDAEMDGNKQPKVILFDIGGVCVSRFTGSPLNNH